MIGKLSVAYKKVQIERKGGKDKKGKKKEDKKGQIESCPGSRKKITKTKTTK